MKNLVWLPISVALCPMLSHAQAYPTKSVRIIVAYTLVDASGARASTSAFNYVVWMFILTSAALIVPARSSVTRLLREGSRSVLLAVIAGGLTFGSYGVALWAMTAAPVALVAALRETSILFGAGLGAWLLKERFGAHRVDEPARDLCACLHGPVRGEEVF